MTDPVADPVAEPSNFVLSREALRRLAVLDLTRAGAELEGL